MERFIMKELLEWKQRADRKPLILRGARQVGKTYAVKDLGERHYRNLVYLNFDHDERLAEFFAGTKEPARILEQLSLLTGQKILPGETLIFFDEVQECPDALNALKYFQEETPEYHIVAAGSLLGVRLADTSFPVGKVDFLDLCPMSFSEFLLADGEENLVKYMRSLIRIEPVPAVFSSRLEEKLRAYLVVGGMPEAVLAWTREKDIKKVGRVQRAILDSYERDFSKHTTETEANRISLIWNGVVSQLARENKKFIYQAIREGARAREYESALNWLKNAGLIEKISCVSQPVYPLRPYEDLTAFKIYALDVGLLSQMAGVESELAIEGERIFKEFKGALAENYIVQALKASGVRRLYYYTFDRHEIDFLLQKNGQIYPVEVKSGQNISHRSLTNYVEKYQPERALQFSTNNLDLSGKILNIPLYLAEYVGKWV